MLLTEEYHDFGSIVLHEISKKLRDKDHRPNNIYYARFLMLLTNHVNDKLVIANPQAKFDSWMQDKRVLSYLNILNLNTSVEISICLSCRKVRKVRNVQLSVSHLL